MKIGRILRYYRRLYNLTQSEVAELSGINEKYLGRIERDESVPTIDKVEQLCLAFDIRLNDMLMIVPEETSMYIRHSDEQSRSLMPQIIFYCNCCGCTFQAAIIDSESEDIRCPECGCLYDYENGYVEKSIVY